MSEARRWRRRFSLVELLVVIGIIAMLAALLLPALKKAKDMALSSLCQGNQRQCGLALVGYAADFDDWVIGGECAGTYATYPSIGVMIMGCGYAPRRGDFDGTPPTYGFINIPFGAVYQCPSLPPPPKYRQWGGNYPSGKNNSNTSQSYGLRSFSYGAYYPGEQQASTTTDPKRRLIKLSSLYQPSLTPYMVDTASDVNDVSDSFVIGRTQWKEWYTSYQKMLHLRHNRRANVWCPDGHVASWDAADVVEHKNPLAGAVSNTAFTYSY